MMYVDVPSEKATFPIFCSSASYTVPYVSRSSAPM